MKKRSLFLKTVFTAASAAFFLLVFSCSRFVYTIKPQIQSVKTYAIVSVYDTGMGMRWSDKGGGSTGILNLINVATADNTNFSLRDLLNYSLGVYEKELSGMEGLALVPFSRLSKLPSYNMFYQTVDKYFVVKTVGVNTASGMIAFNNYTANTIVVDGSPYVPNEAIRDLCQEANLDGVILLNMDLRHKDGGFFQACASVGVEVRMIDKNAKQVLWTPPIGKDGQRFETKQTIPMVADTIKYDQEFAGMLKSAIDDSARFYKKEMDKSIKE